ncbi:hypothetical protein C882_3836 [Caenispirillum salinarum AK4]|uniref:Uncharacterized protein n=1 Tax=Caenispirillum salinarum AK4 TaxID=1238182 RepID=K9HM88_9PROT|nr:hypothetical protein [Caenispirillum salinarum]EKV31463.1 hypothetical protein C882_3836 [Caenispirillum salinarum AK4]
MGLGHDHQHRSRRDHIRRNTLIWFLVQHCAAGIIAGLVFCAAVIATDMANMRTLLFGGDGFGMTVGLYLLVGSICGTFGSVAMAVGIMRLGDHRDHPDREY